MATPQPFRIKTAAFPEGDLFLESLSCSEALSTLTEINASLLSPRADLDSDDILGQPVTFEIELRGDTTRFLNGFVTRFSQVGGTARLHRYQAVVRPWLWFLTRTTDSRIFQHMKVPEIVKSVFDDHSIAVHDFKLFREYREWEYCVQYRESDFNFVSRLLEHEGIYYRFEHSDGKHQMLLLDSGSAHDPQPDGAAQLPFFATAGQVPPDVDFVSRWAMSRSVQSGKFAITDYDFENPSSRLLTTGEQPRKYAQSDAEAFDYPGGFTVPADGAQYLENRRDEVQSRFERFSGSTNAQGLRTGFTFKLTRHPRPDQNAEYLVTGARLQATNGGLDAGQGVDAGFECEFNAMSTAQQFRPQRVTRKPFVQGPQTAFVVGKSGDEIHTDRFGRVRVQFHWDRLGKKDEKSSCMVRVAQVWAGKNFGAIFIPRVGQEVIVDFLEGDPDQPIITGSVYNGEALPPFKLPDHATQSGFLTRSTKDGAVANANMIQFEDKKGSEALNLHAEKNMSTSVENDQSNSVGHDLTEQVTHDRKSTVGNKDTLIIDKGGRSVTIKALGESVNVTGGRKYTVGAGLDQNTIKTGRITAITGPESLFVTGAVTRMITGTTTEIYNGDRKAGVIGDLTETVSGKVGFQAGGAFLGKAASFGYETPGNVEFKANQFNRLVNQANDTFLGPNTGTYIGAATSTMIAGARNTFIGLKNELELAIALRTSIGASVNTTVAACMNMGVAVTVDMMAGPTLEMGPLGLQQKTMDVAQSAMKIITGGGGGGGGGGGAAAAGAFAVGFGAVAGVSAALANAAAACVDAVEFLTTVSQQPDGSVSQTLLGTLLAMPATVVGLGAKSYGDDHPEQSDAAMAQRQAALAAQTKAAAEAGAKQAQADANAATARAEAQANAPVPASPAGGSASH